MSQAQTQSSRGAAVLPTGCWSLLQNSVQLFRPHSLSTPDLWWIWNHLRQTELTHFHLWNTHLWNFRCRRSFCLRSEPATQPWSWEPCDRLPHQTLLMTLLCGEDCTTRWRTSRHTPTHHCWDMPWTRQGQARCPELQSAFRRTPVRKERRCGYWRLPRSFCHWLSQCCRCSPTQVRLRRQRFHLPMTRLQPAAAPTSGCSLLLPTACPWRVWNTHLHNTRFSDL